MENRFGFIHDEFDIKVLILFIVSRLPAPVSMEAMADMTLLCDDGISYFDFADCFGDLITTGHLTEKDDMYTITEKGRVNEAAAESNIPYSVRIRAERAASTLARVQKRNAMIDTSHSDRGRGGYTVRLTMNDDMGKVLSMEVLIGDELQASTMEKNFRKNAENVYTSIVEMLLKE